MKSHSILLLVFRCVVVALRNLYVAFLNNTAISLSWAVSIFSLSFFSPLWLFSSSSSSSPPVSRWLFKWSYDDRETAGLAHACFVYMEWYRAGPRHTRQASWSTRLTPACFFFVFFFFVVVVVVVVNRFKWVSAGCTPGFATLASLAVAFVCHLHQAALQSYPFLAYLIITMVIESIIMVIITIHFNFESDRDDRSIFSRFF